MEYFRKRMDQDGWVIFDSVLSKDVIGAMLKDLEKAYEVCRALQMKNGVATDTEWTVHHVIGLGESFLKYIEELPLIPFIEDYFDGKFILNSFGGAINSAHSRSYAHRVHRDIRTFSGDQNLVLNTLVMLDDFTAENGSTFLMPGSHRLAEKPEDETFKKSAVQAIGKAGSILMFNSNLWHAGGDNMTDYPRRSMTPMFSKPFIKQGFDYPRALGYQNFYNLNENARQILGYYARVPANLEEWYQLPQHRLYRPGQG